MSQKVDRFSSQPWLHETRPHAMADSLKERTIDFSSGRSIGSGSKITNSEKTAPVEETDALKLSGIGMVPPPDGLFGSERRPKPQVSFSVLPSTTDGCVQPSKQDLGDHSMAYGQYQFSELHCGVMPPYPSQALPHLHCLGVHSSRTVLPLDVSEDLVYVNAKQYHAILRRRESRAKAELKRKLIKVRRPYLHESRHLHAMRRARGCGGRFLNTKELRNGSCAVNAPTKWDITISSEKTGSTRSAMGSLSSESVPFNLFLSKPQATSHDHMLFQLSSHLSLSDDRAAEAWNSQERVIGRGLPHDAYTTK